MPVRRRKRKNKSKPKAYIKQRQEESICWTCEHAGMCGTTCNKANTCETKCEYGDMCLVKQTATKLLRQHNLQLLDVWKAKYNPIVYYPYNTKRYMELDSWFVSECKMYAPDSRTIADAIKIN